MIEYTFNIKVGQIYREKETGDTLEILDILEYKLPVIKYHVIVAQDGYSFDGNTNVAVWIEKMASRMELVRDLEPYGGGLVCLQGSNPRMTK